MEVRYMDGISLDNKRTFPGVFVFDMDEVLVDISPEMYRTVRFNWRRYHRYFKDLGPLTDEQVFGRDTFHLLDWLLKSEYRMMPKEELQHYVKVVLNMLKDDYFELDNLYDKLEPTEFAKKTIINKSFIEHNNVKKIYILTRYFSEKMIDSKKRFISKYFNHPKVEAIFVPLDKKKSDYLKEKGINWNLLVDDEIRNIRDMAENFDLNGKEFLIPTTGYNSMPPELDMLIREKGGTYNYFKRI
jgi:phosphoglycolate phosphatase-like HAD superfamily hydrolase